MDIFDDEFLSLIKSLNKNNVEYIFVGGLATNLHGFSRMTGDIDIWINDTRQNRSNFRKALAETDLGDHPSLETTQFVPGWSGMLLHSGIELDIMTQLAGLEEYSFEDCFRISPTAEVLGIEIKFLHINFLIQNKKKVNREKDKIDVIELEKIRTESEK
jgi:hypothetical protein